MPIIVPLGDAAVLAEFSRTLDLAVNARIQQLAKAILQRRLAWIRDVVPAIGALAVHFDPGQLKGSGSPVEVVAALIAECLASKLPDPEDFNRTVELPTCYDAEFAPDLEEVAERCELTIEEVVRRHAGSPHRVLMIGFVPGHPYIGGLDSKVSVPRRPTPRPKVVTGSIAIANAQTVIYPYPMSSGWSVIGRTPVPIFDVRHDPSSLMAAGDRVKFTPIARNEFNRMLRDAERKNIR